jgi:hypothetical protein
MDDIALLSKVKAEKVSKGPIPSERVVLIRTAEGFNEEVPAHESQVVDGYLLVSEIHSEDDRILVELPRESSSGCWRLWIPRDRFHGAA